MNNQAPKEFLEHGEYMRLLLEQVKNEGLRTDLIASIETLVSGLNGDWAGCSIAWIDAVPDNAASLFD